VIATMPFEPPVQIKASLIRVERVGAVSYIKETVNAYA
jgi:hypothetical protein